MKELAMWKALVAGIAALALASCTTDVIEFAPGTYTVSADAAFGQGVVTVRGRALEAATAHCQDMEQELVVTDEDLLRLMHRAYQVSFVTFQCE